MVMKPQTCSLWLSLLGFIRLVLCECDASGINEVTLQNLDDLRTPTPYTFTLTALVSGCASAPTTLTDLITWDVAGTDFVAAEPATVTFSDLSLVYATFVFPGMTVTSLTPGQTLTLLDGIGDKNTYIVPVTAIPYATSTSTLTSSSTSITTTSTTTSTATNTSAPDQSSSSGSSTNIAAIIAGSVVGGIAAIAILAFAIYKYKTRQRHIPPPAPIDFTSYVDRPPMEQAYDPKHQSVNIGFDARDYEPISANLRDD